MANKKQKDRKPKDPHAVYLGQLGGKARVKKLSAERRREIAQRAANARWEKQRKDDRNG